MHPNPGIFYRWTGGALAAIAFAVLFGFLQPIGLGLKETTLPKVEVTPDASFAFESATITRHAKHDMLRLRGRCVGENLGQSYEIRPTLEGIDHLESAQGSTWYTALLRDLHSPEGQPFSLDIKNPPLEFKNLQVKVTFKRLPPYLAPNLDPVTFEVPSHLVSRLALVSPATSSSAEETRAREAQADAKRFYMQMIASPPFALLGLILLLSPLLLPKLLTRWWQERY